MCAPGANPATEYTGGINVGNTGVPTTVTLEPGVVVNVTPNTIAQAVAISTGTAAGTGNPATLIANDAAVNLTTTSQFAGALFLHPIQGNATITASGRINLAGGPNAIVVQAAVFSSVPGAVSSVTYTGAAAPGIIDINGSAGADSVLIQACTNDGCGLGPAGIDGNAIINATGNLTGNFGSGSFGLQAVASGNGTATVTYNGGTINLTGGAFSTGIFSSATGDATVTAMPGTAVTVNSTAAGAAGIDVFSGSGATLAKVASTIQVTGPTGPSTGDFRSQPRGIQVQSDLGGPAEVDYTGPGIAVHGEGGLGIAAVSGSPDATTPSGTVTVDASGATGPIIADGSDAIGILADSGTLRNVVRSRPSTTTTGLVQVTASNVSTPGQFGTAISANGGSGGVTVKTSGSIMGGWQATPFAPPATPLLPGRPPTAPVAPAGNISSLSGLPAAGVFLSANGGGTAKLMNNGSIGALSDLAIAGDPQVTNNGTITGFVKFTGDNNSIINNNMFDIRHFADTDGTGGRDTKRVAISDFGGINGQFVNGPNGVVKFARFPGAATTDATGYYLPTTGVDSRPLEASFYDFHREGLLQGQFVNLETFDNRGIIDLRGSVTGNTLVITSNPAAGGTPGTGTYISNGGQLLLNTVLNAGIPPGGRTNSYSDMLIVDQTRLGTGGATSIGVTVDPASAGALTPGNGIELVEVRDKAGSPDGIFVLGSRAASGAFEYTLFHNGVGGDAADGNWYLRSTFIPPPLPPTGGGGGSPPPVEELPNIRAEVADELALPALASRLGLDMIGTYHDRFGEDYPDPAAPVAPVFCKDPSTNYRCTPTAEQAALYAGAGPRYMAAWGRLLGENGQVDFSESNPAGSLSNFLNHGPSYDFTLGGIQTGMDIYRKQNDDGSRDVAGFYFGYGRITADVDRVFGGPAGSDAMNGYSFGGYWTHIGPAGWYVDGVLQGTRYDQAHSNSNLGERLDTAGWGFAASLEGGYPVALGYGWTIEPQAQLVYQHITLDDAADHFGLFGFGDTDAVYGRLGARLSHNWALADGRLMTGWAHADVWSGFGSSANINVSSLTGENPFPLSTDIGGTWGSFGIGLSGQITQNVRLFASGDYNVGFDSGDFSSWGGRVGLKVVW
jgi:outer membrane autotransporter protein